MKFFYISVMLCSSLYGMQQNNLCKSQEEIMGLIACVPDIHSIEQFLSNKSKKMPATIERNYAHVSLKIDTSEQKVYIYGVEFPGIKKIEPTVLSIQDFCSLVKCIEK